MNDQALSSDNRYTFDKVYLEITNICNLDCSFCHKTNRERKMMSESEFDILTDKLCGRTKYLYFHLMGEPMLHPMLPRFIEIARQKGFLPMLTTNGSLISKHGGAILAALPHKINISLHAPAANTAFSDGAYLDRCISFAKDAASHGCIVVLRLWNLGTGTDNSEILSRLHSAFTGEWKEVWGGKSMRLSDRLFLEWGDNFDWPDPSAPERAPSCDAFCYGLRDHIGVLCDGSVVPCCLDADGLLTLGNLFDSELDEILDSTRARAIFDGFSARRAIEPLCRKCGFAKRFSRDK